MASPPSNDADSPPLPPNGIRTTVTFLIFVHFFFLLISIKSKMTSSGLEQDLRDRAPGLTPYVQLLGMDLPYTFHLTYYDPSQYNDSRADLRDLNFRLAQLRAKTPDANTPREIQETERRITDTQLSLQQTFRPSETEFYVEATLLGPDDQVEKTILWPSNDLRPGARFHRFQRLVATAVNYIDNGNDGPATMIAKGIADRIMAENKSRTMKLRFRRRVIVPNLAQRNDEPIVASSPDPNAEENFPLVYKLGLDRDAGIFELTAIRTDDGSVIVTETKGGYNAAAPSQAVSGPTPPATATATATASSTATPTAIPTAIPTATPTSTAAPSASAPATGAAPAP